MSQSYEHILVDEVDDIATITFNRPALRNALHLEMNLEIRAAMERMEVAGNVRALIFTGAGGKAFVSGADIAELRDRKGPEALARHNARLCDAIASFSSPTIAAIRGWALGGGCEVALACDMRVGGRSAKMGQPEVGLGILPAAGGTWRLPQVVGVAKAKELIFTGAIVDADEALALGLLNHVVDDESVMARSLELAASVAAQSPMAVRLAKVAINSGRESSEATGSMLEALAQTVLYDDQDKHDRMTAFLEKRAARAAAKGEKNG